MTIDNTLLIISGTLLVFSFVTPMLNVMFRRLQQPTDDTQTPPYPKVSILFVVDENLPSLERNISYFQQQDYESGFDIIVVSNKSKKDTDHLLKQFGSSLSVHHTFVPPSSRYMSRKKLAVTLGVKAAKTEWIILIEPTLKPTSNQWLKTMAAHFTDKHDMVMGYSYYETATDYQHFLHHQTMRYLMIRASKSTAYRTNMNNIAFRKSCFIAQDGFRGNLKYIGGEYDFLVNKYAKKGNTAVALTQEAWMEEEPPSKRQWDNTQLFYQATRKHLRRSFFHRLIYGFDTFFMLLHYVILLVVLCFSVMTKMWWMIIVALIAFIITYIYRAFIARKALKAFHQNIPAWKLPFFEIRAIITRTTTFLKYWKSDKYDFICHKI